MTAKKIEELLKEKKIYQIINSKIVKANPNDSLQKVIESIAANRGGYVVVAEDNRIRGMFTETDVAMKILGKNVDMNQPVSNFMTKNPFVLKPEDTVGEAIDLMAKKSVYHLPLVDEQQNLVGMLSVRTLIRFLAEYYPTEIYNLPPDPTQVAPIAEGG